MFLQLGPIVFNLCRSPRHFRRHKSGWVWFFGVGSIAYWSFMTGVDAGRLR